MFGAQPTSAFGTPSSTPVFGTPSSTPAFGTPSSIPAFGTPSTPSFATGFGTSLFSTPFSQQSQPQPQQQQQQQQTSLFQPQQSSGGFGFSTPFGAAQAQSTPFGQSTLTPGLQFGNAQLTTQMAPVAPLPFSLADRDIQAIVDAYKMEPGNPKYAFKWRMKNFVCICVTDSFDEHTKGMLQQKKGGAFGEHLLFSVTEPQYRTKPAGVSDIMWSEAMGKLEGMESSNRERLWPQLVQGFKDLSQRLKHLLFSVTEPQYRTKPAGVSDIMWSEAMGKLEGMESSNRERLWPQLVQGFKDLSQRLKLQDEVIISDAERLKMTQSNVKMLQRHFQADTLPWIERLRQKEQGLQRRLLRVRQSWSALLIFVAAVVSAFNAHPSSCCIHACF
ncbi:unnamed protein product [Ilex paraguariensis]|uniref:Nucleoporin Nup54 alpha-helical domain-containing protein n=1 Tax=Ilex paraguariensis TaxID=185542 RepID=A0ABC8R5L7_9AQUA